MSRNNHPPRLCIVSQAQYGFFNRRLKYMTDHTLDVDPKTGIDRQTIVKALQAVTFDELPLKAGMPAPVKTPPAELAKRIEGIKVGNRTVCYLVRKPTPVFFIASAEVWSKLHEAMPDVKRSQCMTLGEVRSFMELEGVTVKSLKEAAEWWASDAPPETVPQPQPQTKGGWVDDPATYGCDCDCHRHRPNEEE